MSQTSMPGLTCFSAKFHKVTIKRSRALQVLQLSVRRNIQDAFLAADDQFSSGNPAARQSFEARSQPTQNMPPFSSFLVQRNETCSPTLLLNFRANQCVQLSVRPQRKLSE
jgi:hypothetical protein